jgi:hypothetical protein
LHMVHSFGADASALFWRHANLVRVRARVRVRVRVKVRVRVRVRVAREPEVARRVLLTVRVRVKFRDGVRDRATCHLHSKRGGWLVEYSPKS